MVILANRVQVAAERAGDELEIQLGPALPGFQSLARAGIKDEQVVRYVITDGAAWEVGEGTYSEGEDTPVLWRLKVAETSRDDDEPLDLGAEAVLFIDASSEDVAPPEPEPPWNVIPPVIVLTQPPQNIAPPEIALLDAPPVNVDPPTIAIHEQAPKNTAPPVIARQETPPANDEPPTIMVATGKPHSIEPPTIIGAPVLTSIDPDIVPLNEDTSIILTGRHFRDTGLEVWINDKKGGHNPPTLVKDTEMTYTVNLSPAGTSDIWIHDAENNLDTDKLKITARDAPVLDKIDPVLYVEKTEFDLKATGSKFPDDVDIYVNYVKMNTTGRSATAAQMRFDNTRPAGDVTITVGLPHSKPKTLTLIKAPVPHIDSLDPASAPDKEAHTLAIKGSGFLEDVSIVNAQLKGASTVTQWSKQDTDFHFKSTGEIAIVITLGTADEADIWITNGDKDSNHLVYKLALPALPAPKVTGIAPTTAVAGVTFNLTINGENFVTGASAHYYANADDTDTARYLDLTTVFLSAKQLTADVNIGPTGDWCIRVKNPDNQWSDLASAPKLRITEKPAAPAPEITGVSPASYVEHEVFAFTITGTNFRQGDKLRFSTASGGPWDYDPKSASATQLTFEFTSGWDAGKYFVQIVPTTAPPSNKFPFELTAKLSAPKITSISPTTQVEKTPFALTINGENFVSGATAYWHGRAGDTSTFNFIPLTTHFVSAKQLTADWPNDRDSGDWYIRVKNPDNQWSDPASEPKLTLTKKTLPAPTITKLDPPTYFCLTDFTLNVEGTGFVKDSSKVEITGGDKAYHPCPTTFTDATHLSATVTGFGDGDRKVHVVNNDEGPSNEVDYKFTTVAADAGTPGGFVPDTYPNPKDLDDLQKKTDHGPIVPSAGPWGVGQSLKTADGKDATWTGTKWRLDVMPPVPTWDVQVDEQYVNRMRLTAVPFDVEYRVFWDDGNSETVKVPKEGVTHDYGNNKKQELNIKVTRVDTNQEAIFTPTFALDVTPPPIEDE